MQPRTPQGPPDRGGVRSGEEPGALPPAHPAAPGTPAPGQAVATDALPCPLLLSQGQEGEQPCPTYSHLWARLASALAAPPRPGACWPAPDDPAGACSAGYVYRSCWAGLRCVLGVQAPPPRSCSVAPLGRAGAWGAWRRWGQDRPALLSVPHAVPSVDGPWAPSPPAAPYLPAPYPHAVPLGSWPFQGWRAPPGPPLAAELVPWGGHAQPLFLLGSTGPHLPPCLGSSGPRI